MESIKKGEYKDIILSIDEENNKCVDCGKENPSKVEARVHFNPYLSVTVKCDDK